MKYLILFIIISVNLYSQDLEPIQHQFDFQGKTQYLGADSAYFQQTKFMLGWHWGSGKKISQSLLMNQNDSHSSLVQNGTFGLKGVNDYRVIDSCNVILKPLNYSHAVSNEDFTTRTIQFEPTLKLNSNKLDSLIKRTGDNEHQVFGFGNVRGRIVDSISSSNYSRLIIDSSSLQNQVILSNNWPKFLY